MADEMDDAPATDSAAGLATGMIALTGLMLLIAIFTVCSLLKNHYNEGPLA
jgi:hypothetical protein